MLHRSSFLFHLKFSQLSVFSTPIPKSKKPKTSAFWNNDGWTCIVKEKAHPKIPKIHVHRSKHLVSWSHTGPKFHLVLSNYNKAQGISKCYLVPSHSSYIHVQWPLTWKRTSWLTRWQPSSLSGFDTIDMRFFSAMARSLMYSSRLGRPSCWDSRDWSWARSMEPNRIMDSESVDTDRERKWGGDERKDTETEASAMTMKG